MQACHSISLSPLAVSANISLDSNGVEADESNGVEVDKLSATPSCFRLAARQKIGRKVKQTHHKRFKSMQITNLLKVCSLTLMVTSALRHLRLKKNDKILVI